MRALYLLFSFLFIFRMPLPREMGQGNRRLEQVKKRGVCVLNVCSTSLKQIGIYGHDRIKCCKK
uniref:Beta-defensin-like domain-containing protein n=1 Tax=Theropithecus gelada TaxID=9565 RepID=A0A8D2FC39_THEGE